MSMLCTITIFIKLKCILSIIVEDMARTRNQNRMMVGVKDAWTQANIKCLNQTMMGLGPIIILCVCTELATTSLGSNKISMSLNVPCAVPYQDSRAKSINSRTFQLLSSFY